MLDSETLIALLGLEPHLEGGAFREVFRSPGAVESSPHAGTRAASTAIYFLLREGEFSAFHRIVSDEVWHHYAGDPLLLYELDEAGVHCRTLGTRWAEGERPLAVVAANTLQAARCAPGPHGFALCGCTVAPGFDFADFEMPSRDQLMRRFPEHAELITALTRGEQARRREENPAGNAK